MKKQLPIGLIIEGNLTNSTILRLPNLSEEAGPVKAGNLRVARRAAKFLQAGFAVGSYAELQSCRLILVRAPDPSVARIVEELCTSSLDLKHLAFIFCETWLPSEHFSLLIGKGAFVGTAIQIPGIRRRKWFVVEGSVQATKQLRRFLDSGGAEALQLKGNTKHLYFAAEALTTAIPAPLFRMALQSLREAGLSGNHLQALLEEFTGKLLRDFPRGSGSPWTGPLQGGSPEMVSSYFQSLRRTNPQIAGLLSRHLGANDLVPAALMPKAELALRRSATLK